MAADITIAPCRDATLVARLSREAWREGVDSRSSGHRFSADDAERLFQEGAVALVASDPHGSPVGSVLVVPGDSNGFGDSGGSGDMELTKLAVPQKDARRSGVGAALVEAAADLASARGVTDLVLAVSVYQPELCRYYANRGFTVVPGRAYRHASPHSPTPIVMVRSLVGAARSDPIGAAAKALLDGRLVIIPTETVYGLGALASDPVAVRRVFATKGRPVDHPLIVHVANRRAIGHWAREVPDSARRLAEALWPGPLTLVLPKARWVPFEVTGGLDTVALRVPGHPEALAVLGLLPENSGIAAPSANRFGQVSPSTAQDAVADIGAHLMPGDLVVDGGPCRVGVESTIVDLTSSVPTILRPGGCPAEEIEAVLGGPVNRTATGPSRAPGMLAAHYAPMAGVLVVDASRVGSTLRSVSLTGQRVGLLGPESLVPSEPGVVLLEAPDPYDGASLAPVLYSRLREADRLGLDVLVVVATEDAGLGLAVNDRLRRAERGSRREAGL